MSVFSEFTDFQLTHESHQTGGSEYELTENLIWEVGVKGSGLIVVVPHGTRFDITVPRWLQGIQCPHDTRLLPCAALHDQLLKQGFDVGFASTEFRRACMARGINRVYAWILFFITLTWTGIRRLGGRS